MNVTTDIFENYIEFYGTNDIEKVKEALSPFGIDFAIYMTGPIANNPDAETAHYIRCIVLRSWGINVEADFVAVKDPKMIKKIDEEIARKNALVFENKGRITMGRYYYLLWFEFEEDVTDAWGEELTLPAALDIQEKVMNEFECNGALLGMEFEELNPHGIYFEIP
ncbi:hypothetical protein C7N43_38310 [Sphingobacteriales bacterium UPWRP_1]|nr:hypothetical protein C7N43_38310 [Sphingobacteriales bacterium UPWRP_1]